MKSSHLLLPLAFSLASVSFSTAVHAQGDSDRVIDEVVVTATKRAGSVQDILAAIDVYAGLFLEELATTAENPG